MSACGTLLVLLLCARTAELRHRPQEEESPGQGALSPRETSLEPGLRSGRRALETSRDHTEELYPGEDEPDPDRPEGHRVPRGAKGPWRRRDHRVSDPDRYFTTPPPRPAPPPLNASVGGAVPLSAGPLWKYAVLLLALVLLCVGLAGNLALMCLVWNSFHLKSAWNCVLAGLALWDFLVLFFCLPVVLFHQLTGTRLMGALSCSLVPFLEVSSMGMATFSLSALSIARFHGATNPASSVNAHVEPCTSILSKLSVVWVGSLLLASPELLLYRLSSLPLQDTERNYSPLQVDVCLAEPSPELPLAVLSLVLTYQEARSWWLLGCYICLPLLFTLSCDLVTRHVMSQRVPQTIGRQHGSSRSSSPSVTKKEVAANRSPSPSASKQEVSSRTSSLNRKLQEREAGLRSVVMALIGLYLACTLPETVCTIAVSYLPSLPVGVSPALRLIGQFLLFVRSSSNPLVVLCFSKALGRAFVHCCCCCCDECGSGPAPFAPDTPTASLATPSTLLASPLTPLDMPLIPLAPPRKETPPEQQQLALGTPC